MYHKNAKFVVHSPAFRAGKGNITSVYKMQAFRGVEVKICSFIPPALEGYFTPVEMTPGSHWLEQFDNRSVPGILEKNSVDIHYFSKERTMKYTEKLYSVLYKMWSLLPMLMRKSHIISPESRYECIHSIVRTNINFVNSAVIPFPQLQMAEWISTFIRWASFVPPLSHCRPITSLRCYSAWHITSLQQR